MSNKKVNENVSKKETSKELKEKLRQKLYVGKVSRLNHGAREELLNKVCEKVGVTKEQVETLVNKK